MSEQPRRTATEDVPEDRPLAGTRPPERREPAARPTADHSLRARIRRVRNRIRRRPKLNLAWRIGVGVLGSLVLALGILAIPYPGPGWLIVFAGLGILASEFTWAQRVLHFARGYYDRWSAWVRRQNIVVQLLLALLTGLIVVATIWLLGGFGLVGGWVGLDSWTWLQSPIM